MNYQKKILKLQEKAIDKKIDKMKTDFETLKEIINTVNNKDRSLMYLIYKAEFEIARQILKECFGTEEPKITANLINIEKIQKLQKLFNQLIYSEKHYIERKN